VTRIRASKLSEILLLAPAGLGLAACALGCSNVATGGRPAEAPPENASEAPPRRPDAVVLDPPPTLPRPQTRATASSGVMSLREPLGSEKVIDLVQAFVGAWQRGSLDGLATMLTPDAGPLEARAKGRGGLLEAWRQRMRAHEYVRLAGMELVRPERIEHWETEDLDAPGAPRRPPEMLPGEVYVRVPLEVTTVAGEKVFDDVLVMILRPDDGRFRIVAYGETGLSE
jgi:hypothetical protein